jgi:hypothetical protein
MQQGKELEEERRLFKRVLIGKGLKSNTILESMKRQDKSIKRIK